MTTRRPTTRLCTARTAHGPCTPAHRDARRDDPRVEIASTEALITLRSLMRSSTYVLTLKHLYLSLLRTTRSVLTVTDFLARHVGYSGRAIEAPPHRRAGSASGKEDEEEERTNA